MNNYNTTIFLPLPILLQKSLQTFINPMIAKEYLVANGNVFVGVFHSKVEDHETVLKSTPM